MLYEATGGRRFTFAVATDIRDKLGLTDDEFSSSFTVGDVPRRHFFGFVREVTPSDLARAVALCAGGDPGGHP